MTKLLVGRVAAIRSRTMAAVRAQDTGPELVLRKALSAEGLRYRLHKKDLSGRPDIVFPRQKVAVFCDGDFWHGRKWRRMKAAGTKFRVRNSYWTTKIEGNIARDKRNNRELRKMGWLVLRYWETDIQKHAARIAKDVRRKVQQRSHISGALPRSDVLGLSHYHRSPFQRNPRHVTKLGRFHLKAL